MNFETYPKIYRLGHSDIEGILQGKCYIQEKIDGANTSIWLQDGEIHVGSRNNDITGTDNLNNFYDYVMGHEGIKNLLNHFPYFRLYGEWLIKHTINYSELHTKQFYLFDIFEEGEDGLTKRRTVEEVNLLGELYSIKTPHLFAVLDNPIPEEIEQYVGQSKLGDKGEGVVIKNFDFINKFGRNTYAKLVTEKFKEDNAITFGSNNKHSDTYWEMYIVNKYVSLGRVEKVKNKLIPLLGKNKEDKYYIDNKGLSTDLHQSLLMLTSRVASTVYHDLLSEEIWEIAKKAGVIDFKALSRLVQRKAIQIYHYLLNNKISIYDQE